MKALEVNHLTKQFERKIALSSLSFSIDKGEKVALIGPSGSGKSTLLNILAGVLQPDSGEIFIDERKSSDLSHPKARAKKIGIIRQQFDLVGPLPVIQNVLAGRLFEWGFFKSLLSLFFPQEKDLAINALKRVGLEEKHDKKTSTLSGGEQQRVALARLLVQKPEIILADEPVASLDPARAEDILALLTSLTKEEGQTLITSLHSVELARKYFSRIIAIREGKLLFDLPSNEVTESQLNELYSIKEMAKNGA